MPVVPSAATILVTGASGFIGSWVVRDLLERGFSVRAAVRNQESGEALTKIFSSYDTKFTLILVPDISKSDAYDEAVRDVDGIAHVASPVTFNEEDPQKLIGPAVQGTVGILRSAQLHGPKVKRVVITSSVSAIIGDFGSLEPRLYDENDWNEVSVERVKEQGFKASALDKYAASKTLAERAAWEYIEKNKPAFELATVLPSMTFGRLLHDVPSPEKLGSSPALFYSYLQPGKTSEELKAPLPDCVDVADVAELHYLALTRETGAGSRIIASNVSCSIQDIYDALHAAGISKIPKGEPSTGTKKTIFNHAKVLEWFPDFKFRPLSSAFVEATKQFDEKGWLN